MTKNILLPTTQDSSPARVLLNQRLSKYRKTVVGPTNPAFDFVVMQLLALAGFLTVVGYPALACWAFQTVSQHLGSVGVFCLLSTYLAATGIVFKVCISPEDKKSIGGIWGFPAFLWLGPWLVGSYVTVKSLVYKPLNGIEVQLGTYCAARKWLKNPRQSLLDALQKHEQEYPLLWIRPRVEKGKSDSQPKVPVDADDLAWFRREMETWKGWWQAFKQQSEQDGCNTSELAELTSMLMTELESSIIYNSDILEPKARKLFEAAKFQIDQIQEARTILAELDDLKQLRKSMELARAKLTQASEALNLIAEARSLAALLPELKSIITDAEKDFYLDWCEEAHDKINALVQQAEKTMDDHSALAA